MCGVSAVHSVLSPLVPGTVDRLNPIKTAVSFPKLVANSANVSINSITLDQALPGDVVQCVVGLDMARSPGKSLDDPEFCQCEINQFTPPLD